MKYFIFSKLSEFAQIPKRATQNSAGLDLYSAQNVDIPPHVRALIKTDIAWKAPKGHYGLICDRSGLALKSGGTVLGGVIDADYLGNIGIILYNTSTTDTLSVKIGDRIAQLVVHEYSSFPIIEEEANKLGESERGTGGFGSTGK